MNEFTITTILTAIFAIIIVPLCIQITVKRAKMGNVCVGDANDDDLRRKRETLGNYSEYVPLGLLLLAVFEYQFGQSTFVILYASLFLTSRILHILGMLYFNSSPVVCAIAIVMQHILFVSVGGTLLYTVALS